jgi:hypothetical protein
VKGRSRRRSVVSVGVGRDMGKSDLRRAMTRPS